MAEITYKSIEALLLSLEVEGRSVRCQFFAGADRPLSATSPIRKDQGVTSRVGRDVKLMVANRARSAAASQVHRLLGGDLLGRAGSHLVRRALTKDVLIGQDEPTQAEIEAAVVSAFGRLRRKYEYDAASQTWRYARAQAGGALGGGAGREAPPKPPRPLTRFEREVLARLVVTLAYADGEVSPQEAQLISELVGASMGSIEEIRARDPISPLELASLADDIKGRLMDAALCLLYADFKQHPRELVILEEFAHSLGYSAPQMKALTELAKLKVLESIFDEDVQRSEVIDVAEALGIDAKEAELALIRYKQGLA